MSEKNNKYTPNLRFPEFIGEWEVKKLGEECEITAGGDVPREKFSKEKTDIYNVPIISNGIGVNAIYGYTDSAKINQNSVTVSARGTIGYAEYRDYPYYPIVRLLSVIPKFPTLLTAKYLSYILSLQKYDVANAGIPQLTVPMIGSVMLPIPPSPAEQQKIASCLSAMDELIAAQAEKVDALKEKKTGLMQQLFPQHGETTPRLRFPEFTGEWKEYEFGDCFEIGSGRDYKHLDEGHIPVYGSGGYMCSVNDYLYDGESACIGRKGTINNPILLSGKFWTVDTLFYTYNYVNTTAYFIYLLFQNIDWMKHNEAGGVPSLSKNIIKKIKVFIPSLTEQQKISDCLSALDDQIAAETEKLTALKDYKKGLMQQLFPQPAK